MVLNATIARIHHCGYRHHPHRVCAHSCPDIRGSHVSLSGMARVRAHRTAVLLARGLVARTHQPAVAIRLALELGLATVSVGSVSVSNVAPAPAVAACSS